MGNFQEFDVCQGKLQHERNFLSANLHLEIFNASHMVPYDVPNIAHDMILRFMGTNFSAITDGSAKIPSSVGNDVKPIFDSDESSQPPQSNAGTSPLQDKAMWEGTFFFRRLPDR
jgi:carboxypeptidase D